MSLWTVTRDGPRTREPAQRTIKTTQRRRGADGATRGGGVRRPRAWPRSKRKRHRRTTVWFPKFIEVGRDHTRCRDHTSARLVSLQCTPLTDQLTFYRYNGVVVYKRHRVTRHSSQATLSLSLHTQPLSYLGQPSPPGPPPSQCVGCQVSSRQEASVPVRFLLDQCVGSHQGAEEC